MPTDLCLKTLWGIGGPSEVLFDGTHKKNTCTFMRSVEEITMTAMHVYDRFMSSSPRRYFVFSVGGPQNGNRKLRLYLFFYLILNRSLLLSIRFFYSILLLLNIKK